MMELGATICVPAAPRCGQCPVAKFCAARLAGRERELPVKAAKPAACDVVLDLALLTRARAGCESQVFLIQRDPGERRLAGFWELPEKKTFPGMRGRLASEFSHRIVNDRFRVRVWRASAPQSAPGLAAGDGWFDAAQYGALPLTTIAKKALKRMK